MERSQQTTQKYKDHKRLLSAAAAAAAKSLQSCPTLRNPIDSSPPGSAISGILQARTLEWVAISFSNAWKVKSESEVAQLCPTLCDPVDYTVHWILQARILEWVAVPFSSRSSQLRNLTQIFPTLETDSLPGEPPGKSNNTLYFNPSRIYFHLSWANM